MIDDLRHLQADDDPFQVIEESAAGWILLVAVVIGTICEVVMR